MYAGAMHDPHDETLDRLRIFCRQTLGRDAEPEGIPYGRRLLLQQGSDRVTVNLYDTGKVLIQGRESPLRQALEAFLTPDRVSNVASPVRREIDPALSTLEGKARIGIDESGKGDYFGPLVIAAARIGSEDEPWLQEIGLKDSKQLKDHTIARLAAQLRSALPCEIVLIPPPRYNVLMERMGNLNRLLAWGHARALESLLERTDAELAIADRFADESLLENARKSQSRRLRYLAVPRAEADLAVAAASVLARAGFLRALKSLSTRTGLPLPKGCGPPVVQAGRRLLKEKGEAVLATVAKLHFKTTEKIRHP